MAAAAWSNPTSKRVRSEEQAGDVVPSSSQLQWATQTARPRFVRLFELNCCAIPLSAVGGIFAAPAIAVADLDLGTHERYSQRASH